MVGETIWLDNPFKEIAFSWRHLFLFVFEDGLLKLWAFKDSKEKFEDLEWRKDFREAFSDSKPKLYAIEHGNNTRLIIVAGTFLHVIDFYEYGLGFQEALANAQQTFNLKTLRNESYSLSTPSLIRGGQSIGWIDKITNTIEFLRICSYSEENIIEEGVGRCQPCPADSFTTLSHLKCTKCSSEVVQEDVMLRALCENS